MYSPNQPATPEYFNHVVTAQEEFETLPHTEAFDALMEVYKQSETVSYLSQDIISIDSDLFSKQLSDVLYFRSNVSVSNLAIELISDSGEDWVLNGAFLVDGDRYRITSSKHHAHITDLENNREADLNPLNCVRLLSCIVTLEADHDPTSLDKHLDSLSPEDTPKTIKALLLTLGHLNGRVSVSRNAKFPTEFDDRAIVAKTIETETTKMSGIATKLELNWEIFDANTELTANIRRVNKPDAIDINFGSIQPTEISVESYDLSKQFPELYTLSSEESEKQIHSSDDIGWPTIASTFMATIGPLLREYRHLDEPSLDQDSFDTPNPSA